jgi:PTS system nitrogen regulatory IIA component
MVNIFKYLNRDLILFLKAHTRDEALQELVTAAHEAGQLTETEVFYRALINREHVVTTGIGMGVAIPHAKLPILDDFFIVIGVLKKGVDWKALDGTPVRLIFMIGGPDDKQTEYLQILSGLTAAIKDEQRRKKMAIATMPEEVLALFNTF